MTKVVIIDGKEVKRGRASKGQLLEREDKVTFDDFRRHVAKLAMQKNVPAAVLSVYKELLKLEQSLSESSQLKISADEMAARNLEAERQLIEGGYIEADRDRRNEGGEDSRAEIQG